MKKTIIFGLALMTTLGLSAQTSVLKDVEHNLKSSSPNPEQALKDIQPALTNPETEGIVDTWLLAGRAGFDVFQNAYIMASTGQELSKDQKINASDALYNAYKYYLHALPLDTVIDKKGKPKTKHSKDIIKKINEKYTTLPYAAGWAWEAGDYNKAYDVFEMILELPNNPILGKNAPIAEADTLRAQTMWNQAIAMLLVNNPQKALDKLRQMDGLGYEPDEYYEYAVQAAQMAGDENAAVAYARKGIEKFGAANTSFIATVINDYLNKKDYKSAYALANDAIAQTNDTEVELRSQLYDILGTIAENDENDIEAENHFRKAVEIDPNYAKGWYDLGRILHNRALKVDEGIETENDRVAKVYPLEREAVGYFEKSYNLDETQSNIPGILYRIYYMLGDEQNANYWNGL